jgi:hypothetical protein
MHIGFSLLVGLTIARLASRRWVRVAGLVYPVFILFVIVATGNHFLFDAAAGGIVTVGAWLVARRLVSPAAAPEVVAFAGCAS